MRKKAAKEKIMDEKNDGNATRGFTTDQRIDIESLSMQKETMVYCKNEVAMVSLSSEESALTKLIETAERRAICFVQNMTRITLITTRWKYCYMSMRN